MRIGLVHSFYRSANPSGENAVVLRQMRLLWSDAQQVLSRARIHLFTSVRDSFGAQTLEAATLGVPTVAMDTYGCRAFLHRPGSSLVDPLPGEGLDRRFADALIAALSWSAPKWQSQSEGALAFAAENEYHARARGYVQSYAKAARQSGSS